MQYSAVPPRAPARTRRGRPLKFGRPARSITLTLPEDAITHLRARNRDLGQAVVALVDGTEAVASAPAVVVHQSDDRAVIVVRPVDALRRLRGVDLISLDNPHRALIAFTAGMTIAEFELQVQDLLDDPSLAADDRAVVSALSTILRDARRTPDVRLSCATIIVLEGRAAPKARGTVRPARGTA